MSLLSLTIADTEEDKRAAGYQNRMSMLYGFVITFSVTQVSGFWSGIVFRFFSSLSMVEHE